MLVIIIWRTLLFYLWIWFLFRVMGKREIGELSVLDTIVFIMLADMAVLSIEKYNEPLSIALVPMMVLTILQVLGSFITLKWRNVQRIVEGERTILIRNGLIDREAMKRERYHLQDLLMQLREQDVTSLADVVYATLEPSGKLTVVQQGDEASLLFPLIIEGHLQREALSHFQVSEDVVRHLLATNDIIVNDIFLGTVTNNQLLIATVAGKEISLSLKGKTHH